MSTWWQASDEELLAALAPRQRAINAAHREMLELVAEIARRRVGTAAGFRCDVELIHLTCAISRTAARQRVDAATSALPGRGLTGEALTPVLAATADAVAEDAITPEHIVAIRAVLATLPPHLQCHRDGLETDLAGWAREFDPWTVRQLGRRAVEYLDPDGPAPHLPAPRRRDDAAPRHRTQQLRRAPPHPPRPAPPRPRMRLPRLRRPTPVDRHPPRHPLGRRRTHRPAQPRTPVPQTPPDDPHQRMGRVDRRRGSRSSTHHPGNRPHHGRTRSTDPTSEAIHRTPDPPPVSPDSTNWRRDERS